MKKGKVKFFDTKKNFGFIIDDNDGKEYFFHRNQVDQGYTPNQDDQVQFEVGQGKKGPTANNVSKL